MLRASALCAALLICAPRLGVAAPGPPCAGPLRVAMSSMPDARQVDTTPARHVLDALVAEWGRRARVEMAQQWMPRVRAFSELRGGNVDVVPMATRASERDAYAELVVMGRMKAMLILRKDAARVPDSEAAMLASDLRVIVVRSQEFGARWARIRAALQQAGRLEIVGDHLAAVRMLKAHRADAIFGPPVFFSPTLADEGHVGMVRIVDAQLAEPTDEGFYVSRRLPKACRARLCDAGAELRRSGFYRDLLTREVAPDDRAAFVE